MYSAFLALLQLVVSVLITFHPGGAKAQPLDLDAVLGNATERQEACSNYQLPPDDTDVDFLGPYQSIVVGTVNYTYHRFGPLSSRNTSPNTSLVLVPGSGATSAVWQADFLKRIAQTREVITFDPRGYGSNDTSPASELTIDSIASSLVDFFSALDLDNPDILGWSWGGTITLWLGAFYGESVGSLVALSTSSGGEGFFPGADYDNIIQANQQGQGVPPAAVFPDTPSGNRALCRFIAYSEIMPGPTFTKEQLISQGKIIVSVLENNNTLSEALPSIINPIFVGHGGLDIVLDVENARYLFGNLTLVSLRIKEQAGHGYLYQDAEDLIDEVATFLDAFNALDSDDDGNDGVESAFSSTLSD